VQGLANWANIKFPIAMAEKELENLSLGAAVSFIGEKVRAAYALKAEADNSEDIDALERFVVLRTIDPRSQDHLTAMDGLRNSVSPRGYRQRDPLNEYKNEVFVRFESTLKAIRSDVCFQIFRLASNRSAFNGMVTKISDNFTLSGTNGERAQASKRAPKVSINVKPASGVGRNDLCPCGSGKKYKKCCGKG
jgi:preprotein translocase subunit SecA